MSQDRVQELLRQLREELEDSERGADAETRERIRALEADIQALLAEHSDAPDAQSIMERARAAEVEFANRHPVAEGFVRQLIDTLSRMGV
ncbi:DUF4404 family protein [Algiphilus sp.]|uniref:DUF4404 family protein n=1 Tax=Algiphilus sp. TaxID=1872431 RepID=UPI001CA66A7A|nr:DUF4404 family protein [Algiphilus sp.]MBY8965605.1 DUF4404 family protein [Algiphilus acroporae]MCI5063587.1 DUF4404 family protein [Algiphilus sp.]MCI5104648.1 DUF4404 family protein [Algiphilus sp.]MCR9090349.1 DUF4404 family protein [Pseudomonadota bacterium]